MSVHNRSSSKGISSVEAILEGRNKCHPVCEGGEEQPPKINISVDTSLVHGEPFSEHATARLQDSPTEETIKPEMTGFIVNEIGELEFRNKEASSEPSLQPEHYVDGNSSWEDNVDSTKVLHTVSSECEILAAEQSEVYHNPVKGGSVNTAVSDGLSITEPKQQCDHSANVSYDIVSLSPLSTSPLSEHTGTHELPENIAEYEYDDIVSVSPVSFCSEDEDSESENNAALVCHGKITASTSVELNGSLSGNIKEISENINTSSADTNENPPLLTQTVVSSVVTHNDCMDFINEENKRTAIAAGGSILIDCQNGMSGSQEQVDTSKDIILSRENDSSNVHTKDISPVQIKSEYVDKGYDHALTAGSNSHSPSKSQQGLLSKAANRHRTKGPEIISTTTRKEGKKTVRITVIRGEWRTPKEAKLIQKEKRKSVNREKQTLDSPITVKKEPVSDSKESPLLQKTARKTAQQPVIVLVPAPQSEPPQLPAGQNILASEEVDANSSAQTNDSAVPTALFRNAYIKSEVVDNQGFHNEQDTEDREDLSSSRGDSRHDKDVSIPSLIAMHSGCDRRRRRVRDGVRSEGARQLQETLATQKKSESEKSKVPEVRKCVVRLDQLPRDIITAGIVNLKADPKMLSDAIALSTSLRLHKRPRDTNRPYECEQCGKRFKQRSHRWQHYKVHIGIKEHRCDLCGADFMYRSTLTAHLRFKHGGEKPYQCTVCQKAFSYSSHLSVHMQRHYDERPLTCPICYKQYAAYYIVNHMKTHSDKRIYSCKVCGAQLKSKKGLEVHESVHDGLRPWKCSMCQDTFPYKSSLTQHERCHRGERPYICDQCPATFTQSTHLRTHLKGVHKIENPSSCKAQRTKVERVPAQKLDNSKEDAILLMRRAMSKVAAQLKVKRKIQPVNSTMPLNTSNSESTAARVGKHRKMEDSVAEIYIEDQEVDDDYEDGFNSHVKSQTELSNNVKVKLDFRKRRHFCQKK